MKVIVFCAAFAIGTVGVFYLNQTSAETDPLSRAVAFVRKGSSERYLRHRSSFLMLDTPRRPSDWLSYFFSAFSTRNWHFEGGVDAGEYPVPPGAMVVPAGVAMMPCRSDALPLDLVDPSRQEQLRQTHPYQLLISTDDEGHTVHVRGFQHWQDQPLFEDTWPFPRLGR